MITAGATISGGAPRIGIGTDVHRLVDGAPLHLAGLALARRAAGLEGHSDADVVAHAACDALLSAAGLGDLGTNFGTSEPEWAGASGRRPARRDRAAGPREAGFEIGNVAVQVIGNRPRLGPRRAEAEAAPRRGGRTGLGLGDHDRRARPHRSRRGRRRDRHRAGDRGLTSQPRPS